MCVGYQLTFVLVFLFFPPPTFSFLHMGSKPSVPEISDEEILNHSLTTTPDAKLPIIYSDVYNIGFWKLENLHPFDSKVSIRSCTTCMHLHTSLTNHDDDSSGVSHLMGMMHVYV